MMVWSLTESQTSWSVNEVRWALGSISTNKASGSDGIPAELFQTLKDDAVKVLHSICQQISKTQQWLQDQKKLLFIPVPKKGNAKECSDYQTVALILQGNAQNLSSQALTVRELRPFRCTSSIQKRQMLSNFCAGEESSLDCKEMKPVNPKGNEL